MEYLWGDPSGRLQPPVDLDLGCSVILPGQLLAKVAANELPELSELSQQEVLTNQMGHPVVVGQKYYSNEFGSHSTNLMIPRRGRT